MLIDGGTIVAPGALDVAGGITIISDTDVTVKNDALIDVSAGVSGGEVDLEATAGNLTFNGRIKANGTTRAGDGGDVNLFAGGLLSFSGGTIDASSGDMAFGGTISLQSLNGSTTVTVPLNASGGDAGEIDILAGTTLQMSAAADMNVGATGDAGSGGEVDIEATGDITIGGDSDGAGAPAASSEDQQSGGDGADVSIISDTGNVTMNGHIDSSAAAGGLGGDLDLEAAVDLVFSKQLISTSTGDGSGGGDVFLAAGRTLSITQQVNAGGGTGSGGSIEASAGATLTVSAPLLTDGPQLGGTITLQGCTVNITSSGIVSSQGPGTESGRHQRRPGELHHDHQRDTASDAEEPAHVPDGAGALDRLACGRPAARDDPARPDASLLPELSRNDDDVDHHLDHRGGNDDQHDRAARHLRRPRRVGHGAVRRRQSHRGRLLLADLPVRALGQPVHERQQCLHRRRLQRHGHLHACGRQRGNDLPRRRGAVRRGRDLHRHVHRLPGRREEHRAVPRRGGRCDAAERCDGISNVCPPDLPAPAGTACRASAGDCDVAEVCDGTSKSCPADAKRTGVCRPATGSCDVAESCDGVSNACPPDVKAPDGTSCGSGSCSSGAVCQSGVCSGSSQASCGPCETCDPETGGCIQAPQPSCRRPLQSRKAQLAFKQSLKGPASDLVTWKWVDGAATAVADFGDPVGSDDYAFCVYDLSQATPSLLFRSTIPAGGTCGKKPCWSANSDKGFKFASSTGNATGLTSVKLT